MKKRGTGQSWSLDIILAFVIFILIIGIFYTLLNNKKPPNDVDVQIEASTLMYALDDASNIDSELKIISDGSIDTDKLITLYTKDYTNIKQKFSIKGDFCIYIEDQYGHIITVQDDAGENYTGYGSSALTVGGKPCGIAIT